MIELTRLNKLTYLLINNIISNFGLRIRNEDLLYLYKLPPDGYNKKDVQTDRFMKGGSMHVVRVPASKEDIFSFINLDYKEYEKGFENMYAFTNWLLNNCSFITKNLINSLEYRKDSDSIKCDEELYTDINAFLSCVKLSHAEIKHFDIFPAMLYYNIKEEIIRDFFYNEKLEERFRELKIAHLLKSELENKFTSSKFVTWIPELRNDSTLAGMFSAAFINYVTDGHVDKFVNYLVDNEKSDVRRDAVIFYNEIFTDSDEYKIYIVEEKDNTPG